MDEDLNIYHGLTRKAAGPRDLEGKDRENWYRDYIAAKLLPFTLAHFFLFDGEQVSVLAERDKSSQVKNGIEGLLGIPVLNQLAHDLRSYSDARSKESQSVDIRTIEKLEKERKDLESKIAEQKSLHEKIEPELLARKEERDRLHRELASFGAGSQALLQEQFEQIKDLERGIETGKTELEKLMMKDLALALTGVGLREDVKARLSSEGVRERWESGKDQGDSNLDRFIETIDSGMLDLDPLLSEKQRIGVLNIARNSWEKLWNPPPENCAEMYLHDYLNGVERSKVIEQLDNLEHLGAPAIIDLLVDIAAQEEKLKSMKEEVMRTESIAPHVDKKRARLSGVDEDIEKMVRESSAILRELTALDAQLKQKNIEHAKLTGLREQAGPSERRAARASKVAVMIDEIVEMAVPSQINAIAEAMTNAHSAMSHKEGLVDRISIDEDCDVKMLNADGDDLRGYDLSAGEKQIFTQALFSAVTSVSGRRFPLVIDTPLGRLDIQHRKGVLKHLAERNQQVILLSTDTEVVGEYLQEIEPHVQKKYLVQFEVVGDIGQSSVRTGYFGEEENTK